MVEIAGRGGICHYAFNLCQNLQRHAEVVLLTGEGYELSAQLPSFRVEEVFRRYRTSPFFLGRFSAMAGKLNVLAVHFQLSQHPEFVLLLCLAAKALAKPVVVTAHNVVSHEEHPWEQRIFSAIYRFSDRIIVHAEDNRREMSRIFPSARGKISVIPHGNYMFFNRAPGAVPVPGEGACVLFFGYIRAYKGLMHLIRAISIVRERIPNVRLVIAGKPVEDFSPYIREIRRLGLEGNVVADLSYIPFEKVEEYFQAAHVVALPYLKVYQSGVLQLAYGFSRPVIASDVGGMGEAIDDGKSGFVVPPGDERALAGKLLEFFGDPARQRSMGEYAFGLCRSRFSWERIAALTMEMYTGLE